MREHWPEMSWICLKLLKRLFETCQFFILPNNKSNRLDKGVNWTYIRHSEDARGVFWTTFNLLLVSRTNMVTSNFIKHWFLHTWSSGCFRDTFIQEHVWMTTVFVFFSLDTNSFKELGKLTHYKPVLLIYIPRKYQKAFRFSDVFRGYR